MMVLLIVASSQESPVGAVLQSVVAHPEPRPKYLLSDSSSGPGSYCVPQGPPGVEITVSRSPWVHVDQIPIGVARLKFSTRFAELDQDPVIFLIGMDLHDAAWARLTRGLFAGDGCLSAELEYDPAWP